VAGLLRAAQMACSLPGFTCSVSRSLEEAARDAEWPGRPLRQLRQTQLWQTRAQARDREAPRSRPPSPRSPSPSLRFVHEDAAAKADRATGEAGGARRAAGATIAPGDNTVRGTR
jgi:hypothetical protein